MITSMAVHFTPTARRVSGPLFGGACWYTNNMDRDTLNGDGGDAERGVQMCVREWVGVQKNVYQDSS